MSGAAKGQSTVGMSWLVVSMTLLTVGMWWRPTQ